MKNEITTRRLTREQMKDELAFLVGYLLSSEIEECDVYFGFPWASAYYPGPEWKSERMRLEELPDRVTELEARELGRIGSADLFIEPASVEVEFLFCHESDIHLAFSESSSIVSFFHDRWRKLGFMCE